ncbi:MAG: hypothetical protein QM817_36565 [Archangium sp.]
MTRLGAAWLAITFTTGCTLANGIDVCRRTGAPERDLNSRTEGNQRFSSRNAVGAMPSGGALAVWTSASTDGMTSEVRGALVAPDGALLPTCEADGEYTYSRSSEFADEAIFAPPRTTNDFGVVAYRTRSASGHTLRVVPVTPSGCPVPPGLEPNAVELRRTKNGAQVLNPSVTSLGASTYVIMWTEMSPTVPRAHLFAQRFRLSGVGHALELLPTPLGPLGEVAEAVERNGNHANGTLIPLVDGAALAFFVVDSPRFQVRLVRFDTELVPRFNALVAEVTIPTGLVPDGVSIAVAHDSDTFLVGWMAGDENAKPVLEARFLDAKGNYLTAPRAPSGETFRLGSVGSSEGEIALLGTGEGGFLAAWQEVGSLMHQDQSGRGLRALAFDSNGEVRFANRACAATDFPLNLAQVEDQTQPVLARLADGTLLSAWVTNGGDTADRSGTGLRVVGLSQFDLLPLR